MLWVSSRQSTSDGLIGGMRPESADSISEFIDNSMLLFHALWPPSDTLEGHIVNTEVKIIAEHISDYQFV